MEQSAQTTMLRIKLREAMLLAEKAHSGQTDKAGQPYFHHPRAVSEIVGNLIFSWYGAPEIYEGFLLKAEIVSLLHDVIEDTNLTIEDLRKKAVPSDCIKAIKALTKTEGQSYDDYLANLKSDRLASIVKIADLTHNSDLTRLAKVTPEDMKRWEKYQKAIQFLESFQCAQCGRVKHVSQLGDNPAHTAQPLCASCVDKYTKVDDEYEEWIAR